MKRKFKTYADCEAAYNESETARTCLQAALAEVLAERVKWFRAKLDKSLSSVGLVQPTRAHGGIVIVRAYGQVSAHYFEQWANEAKRHAANGCEDYQTLLPTIDAMYVERQRALDVADEYMTQVVKELAGNLTPLA